jgi:hypothetical protein
MIENPILTFQDHVIYDKNGGACAYYRITENTIGLNSLSQENELRSRIAQLTKSLSPYGEVHYMVLPVALDIEKRTEELKKQFAGKYQEIGYYYADRAKEVLKEEAKDVVEYKFFIGVKLKRQQAEDNNLFKAFTSSFKDFTKNLQKLAGVLGNGVDDEYIRLFSDSEESARQDIGSFLKSRPATPEEIRYIIRHNFVRGQGKLQDEKNMYALTQGILDPTEPGYLKLEQIDKSSYVAFIPVVEFPINMTGSSWLFNFQSFNFPVEVSIRTEYKGKEQDYNQTNKIKKRFRDQDSQLLEANEDEDSLVNSGRILLHELENRIKNENLPLLRTHATFVVAAETKLECKKRADILIKHLEKCEVEAVRPLADQLQLFHQALPASSIVKQDWEQVLTPESFAESLFSLTRKVGNTVGFYLGKDISQEGEELETSPFLVFHNPFLAHLGIEGSRTSSPHVTISGPTGMGKSYLLKDLLLNSIFWGAKVLLTDPKDEVEQKFKAALTNEVYQQAPFFADIIESFNYITLSVERADAGKLDPLTFLEGEEAFDTAVSVLERLGRLENNERQIKNELYRAVKEVIQSDKQPGLLKVLAIMKRSEDKSTRQFAEMLYEIGTNGIAKLMFSDGTTKGIDLNEQINVLQIQNLSLPEEGHPPMTPEEHIAVCLMIPLAKFATKFARDDSTLKLTIFEEAWMLTNTGQGGKLIKEMLRTGRSLKSAVYIVSQSVVDYNKQDIKEQIGCKFVFQAKDPQEQKTILEYLGIEDNTSNRELVEELTEGECLYQDIYGRTAKIRVDVLFEEWVQAFNTKEENEERARAEELFI